jgi:hypothetical protein
VVWYFFSDQKEWENLARKVGNSFKHEEEEEEEEEGATEEAWLESFDAVFWIVARGRRLLSPRWLCCSGWR